MSSITFCRKCGKKIEGDSKTCDKCGSDLFTFRIYVNSAVEEKEHVEAEEEAANTIIDDLGIDKSLFKYVKPSDDYSTIQYKGFDLFRIKYTENTKWIQLPLTTQMRKANKDNKLFDAEPNKNKVFWKSNINNLHDYKELLLETIDFREKEEQKKN